jgi:hypothetical protein
LPVACSNAGPKNRTRSEFCVDWANAACSKETVSACQAADGAACRKSQESACLALVPDNFSDAMGDACITAVQNAYSDADLKGDELSTVLSLGGPCGLIIRGSKGPGESCSTHRDCDAPAGFACVRKPDQPNGTCQKPEVAEAGRNCAAAQKVCVSGFYCNGGNCIESKAAGETCTTHEECGTTGFCNDGGKCEVRAKVSAECTSDIQCSSGVCYEFENKKTCTDRIVLARSEPLCKDLR